MTWVTYVSSAIVHFIFLQHYYEPYRLTWVPPYCRTRKRGERMKPRAHFDRHKNYIHTFCPRPMIEVHSYTEHYPYRI